MGFLYWDGQITQKTLKKDHLGKAEAIWKTLAGQTAALSKQVGATAVLHAACRCATAASPLCVLAASPSRRSGWLAADKQGLRLAQLALRGAPACPAAHQS